MRKVLIYNSWKDKAPFGALKVNQEPRINVYSNEGYNVSNIRLVLFRDNQDAFLNLYEKGITGVMTKEELTCIESMDRCYIREKELVKEYK